MASFHIAFDDSDAQLGLYFQDSKIDLVNFIVTNSESHSIHEIPSASCNIRYIDPFFKSLEKQFLFIAYSHGNDSCLTVQHDWYVNSPENTQHFANSLFYSMACSTGKVLGPELVEKGCLAFIGYSSTAYAAIDEPFKQMFIECDNYGIKCFINGLTVQEAMKEMKFFYRQTIKELVRNKKGLMAGYLRSNLGCLVVYGDQNLSFENFKDEQT